MTGLCFKTRQSPPKTEKLYWIRNKAECQQDKAYASGQLDCMTWGKKKKIGKEVIFGVYPGIKMLPLKSTSQDDPAGWNGNLCTCTDAEELRAAIVRAWSFYGDVFLVCKEEASKVSYSEV